MPCQRCKTGKPDATMLFRVRGRTLGPWKVCLECVAKGLRWLEGEAGVPTPIDPDEPTPIVAPRWKP